MKRDFNTELNDDKTNNGIYTFSVASDTPYMREDKDGNQYYEVLVISEDSINFDRLKDERCPFIFEHDTEKQLGVVEKSYINGNKLYVEVKFSETEFAQNILKDIISGVRRNVSIGYTVNEYKMVTTPNDKIPTMLVTNWMPYEVTSCSCPADFSVGYQRTLEVKEKLEMKKEKVEEKPTEVAEDAIEEKKAVEDASVENTDNQEVEMIKVGETEEEKKACENGDCEENDCEEKACGKKEVDCEDKYDDEEEIISLGNITGNRSLAEKFIKEKRSYNDFKLEIKKLNTNNNVIKDTKKMEKFSLRKAIANAIGEISDENASFERSIIDENKKKYASNAQIVVTKENLRAFPDGSEILNQSQYRPDLYTENLRPQNVLAKTGAKVVAVDGTDITFGVCPSGLNAGFVDLNNEIPSADMSWELKTMTPHKLGCYVTISKKALLQDRPDVENIITTDITKALDQCKDEAAICGDGQNNKPTGIYNTSGINEVTLPSGDWTLSTALAFEKPIRDSNDFSENLNWVMNSNMYYKLAATPKSAKEKNEFLINDNRQMIGYPCTICNALPTSGIILGNFDELLVAEFNAMEVSVETDATLARKQAREVQAFEAVDVLVRRKKSFTKGK